MNNKLICPFCEYELQENRTTNLCCPICGLVAPTKLWQALIQSQQDLEESQQATLENAQTVLEIHKDLDIARKALDWIGNNRLAENPVRVEQLRIHARNALEQINRKED